MPSSHRIALRSAQKSAAGTLRLISALLAAVIFLVDLLSTLDIAVAVMYIVVVMLTAAHASRREQSWVTAGCVALTLIAFVVVHRGDFTHGSIARCVFALLAIGLTAALTERNRRATELLNDQADLLNQTGDAIVVRDMGDRIVFWNSGAAQMFGHAEQTAVGAVCHTLLDSQFESSYEDAMRRVSEAGHWQGELTQRKADGSQVVTLSRWSLKRDEKGAAVSILECTTDISARKRAERRMRQQEYELRTALDSIPALVWTSDQGGKVDYLNAYWREHDMAPSQPGVQNSPRIFAEDAASWRQHWDNAIANESAFDAEARLICGDGSVHWFLHRAVPLRGENGRVTKWYAASIDIDNLRKAEDALQKAQAELAHATRVATLGELVASIAHETSQPLAAIITNGEASLRWLDRDPPRLDEVRAGLLRLVGEASRASDVVRRLRALASKSASQMELLPMCEVVHEALGLLQRESIRQKVAVHIDCEASVPPVVGDRVQLQQVLINLAINAMQSMAKVDERPRELRVRVARQDDEALLVTVRDSGEGIDATQLDRLFEAFFSTKKEGMGMGLAICRSIIQSHGGRIWVTSTPGCGSQFAFTLPFAEEHT